MGNQPASTLELERGSGVRERPILFSAEMVRAILEGRKTQTRRVIKPQPYLSHTNPPTVKDVQVGDLFICPDLLPTSKTVLNVVCECIGRGTFHCMGQQAFVEKHCRYGQPGDRLWVRENLLRGETGVWRYCADDRAVMVDLQFKSDMLIWAHHKEQDYCPSIHMPRWASRITLEVAKVRVERLHEITQEDALAEGCQAYAKTKQEVADILISDREPILKDFARMIGTAIWSSRLTFQVRWDAVNGKKYPWKSNPWVWVVEFKRA